MHTVYVRTYIFILCVFEYSFDAILPRLVEHGSRNFEEFLDLLGERVVLKDFPNYRGGLDNRST